MSWRRDRPVLTVYYDAWCPICQATRSRLNRLDWLGHLQFESIRDPQAVKRLGLPMDLLTARMHTRHLTTGHTASGIDAVTAVAAHTPLLMPLWPLLKLAQWTGLGQWLYDQVASRRTIVPVGSCKDETCQLPEHR